MSEKNDWRAQLERGALQGRDKQLSIIEAEDLVNQAIRALLLAIDITSFTARFQSPLKRVSTFL